MRGNWRLFSSVSQYAWTILRSVFQLRRPTIPMLLSIEFHMSCVQFWMPVPCPAATAICSTRTSNCTRHGFSFESGVCRDLGHLLLLLLLQREKLPRIKRRPVRSVLSVYVSCSRGYSYSVLCSGKIRNELRLGGCWCWAWISSWNCCRVCNKLSSTE